MIFSPMCAVQYCQCSHGREREVERVKPLAHFATELLSEQRLDIRLVIDNQHPNGHARSPLVREHLARQGDDEFGERIDLAIDGDRAAMLLRDDVVGDRQAKPGALAGWLGGEERLEQFIPDLGRNTGAVVPHADFHHLAGIAGGDLQRRHEPGVPAVTRPPRGRVERRGRRGSAPHQSFCHASRLLAHGIIVPRIADAWGLIAMDCVDCGSTAVTERRDLTAQGYRRFRVGIAPRNSTSAATA